MHPAALLTFCCVGDALAPVSVADVVPHIESCEGSASDTEYCPVWIVSGRVEHQITVSLNKVDSGNIPVGGYFAAAFDHLELRTLAEV